MQRTTWAGAMLIFLGVAGPALAQVPKAAAVTRDPALEGVWQQESWQSVHAPAERKNPKELWFLYAGQFFEQVDGRIVRKGAFWLDAERSPRWLDTLTPDGRHMSAVYGIDGDRLTICLSDSVRPKGLQFDPPTVSIRIVFRRIGERQEAAELARVMSWIQAQDAPNGGTVRPLLIREVERATGRSQAEGASPDDRLKDEAALLEVQVKRRQAELAQARAAQNRSKLEKARLEQLVKDRVVSQSEFEIGQLEVERSSAAAAIKEAELAEVEILLRQVRTRLTRVEAKPQR